MYAEKKNISAIVGHLILMNSFNWWFSLGNHLVELNRSSNKKPRQKVSTSSSISTGLLQNFAIKTTIPTFGEPFITLASTNEMNHNDMYDNSMPEVWSVKKTSISIVSGIPDILQAVGLCKIEYKAPKCYGKKRFSHVTRSDVTLSEIDFSLFDIGHLDWEY